MLGNFTKNTLITFLTQGVIFVLGIGTSVIIARVLKPEGRGIYIIAILLPTILTTFTYFGISQATVFFIGKNKYSLKEILGNNIIYTILISVFTILIGFIIVSFFSSKLFPNIPKNYLFFSLAIIPFFLFFSNTLNILLGLQKFKRYNFILFLRPFIFLVLIAIFLLGFHFQITAVIIIQVFSLFVASVVLLFMAKREAGGISFKFNKDYLKDSFFYGIKTHLESIFRFLNSQIALPAINVFLNPIMVGLYSLSVGLSEKIWLISDAVGTVLFPKISSETNLKKTKEFTPIVFRNILFVITLLAIFLFLVSRWLIVFLYSPDFWESVHPFKILLIGTVAISGWEVLKNDLKGRGRPILNTYITGAASILNIVLLFILLPRFGIIGTAWATSISYIVGLIVVLIIYCRISGNRIIDMVFIKKSDLKLYKNLFIFLKNLFLQLKRWGVFAKDLRVSYFFRLGYIYLFSGILMNTMPFWAMFYRKYKNLSNRLSIERQISYWRLNKEKVLKASEKKFKITIDELGLNEQGLKKVKQLLKRNLEVEIGEIDQDGLLYSYFGPIKNIPTISEDRLLPKERFKIKLIVFSKLVGIRKEFLGDKRTFIKTVEILYHLTFTKCSMAAILDIDFDKLTITKSYITGYNLQEKIAQKGARIRDYDLIKDGKEYLSPKEQIKLYLQEGKKYLLKTVSRGFTDRLFAELVKIHRAKIELYDIKYRDVIIERKSGNPFFVDFSSAKHYLKCNKNIFSVMRDRDIEKFNRAFNTDKLTYRRIKEKIKNKEIPFIDQLYAPIYSGYGLRIGKIWDINSGYGRWHFILKKYLPPVSGKRILSLGANNAFHEIQMLRDEAKEVIGIELDKNNINQGEFVKEVFEWADNTIYNFRYLHIDMATLPKQNLGNFDMIIALCSLYYLDDESISKLVRYISSITNVFVAQCNIRQNINREDAHSYRKASVEYTAEVLKKNGFPNTRIIAPPEYSRPLVIGQKTKF